MKRNILKAVIAVSLGTCLASCGDSFLDTEYYQGVDVDNGLTSASTIKDAVNGEYYRLYYSYFAGNYAINIGDVPTDISYWNGKNNHFNDLYTYSFTDDDLYLEYIWNYGYKIVDNSARAIKAAEGLYDDATESDKQTLDIAMAEAHALRAYANFLMVNVFAHQVKVDGADFSSQPGLVISEEHVKEYSDVERATVGETYTFILSDLAKALQHFEAAGSDQGSRVYFTAASVKGLLARVNLYLENYDTAYSYAQQALADAGITSLATTDAAYKALYNESGTNTESLFYLAIDDTHNFSANSCGTLWTTYGYSPSPKLQAMYGANDVRRSIMGWDDETTETAPVYGGGKYGNYGASTPNPANITNYLINASEMFLIEAEAKLRASNADINAAKEALLVVAKRNKDITSVNDLPSTKAELLSFLQDECAREKFQEGHRLWDLRRWNVKADVYATGAPNIAFTYTNYNISDLVFPIPVAEINAGFGVTQNDWSNTVPSR